MAGTKIIQCNLQPFVGLLISLALVLAALSEPVWAQNREYGRSISRDRRVSSGYFEEADVRSRFYVPLVGGPVPSRRFINLPPRSGTYRRWRTFLADSHYGIKILPLQTCEECHPQQAQDKHTVRAKITCSQCHGMEPIAGINYYFSPMNTTRRHANVCAKCHEGANDSYANYVIHAPNPAMASTLQSFPALFYVFWFMVALAVGTFLVFLPHTVLWGIRELFVKEEKVEGEHED